MGKLLANKPLVEAIFELRWGHPVAPGQFEDPNYQILVGLLFEAFKKAGYGYYERLETAAIPDQFSGHVVQHRYRVGKDQWPLVQVGKGIITVNDTENYDWEDSFFPRCIQAFKALHEKYPGDLGKLPFHSIVLKYIDAYEFDYDEKDLFDFLEDRMHLHIRIPKPLLGSAHLTGNPSGFAADFSYDIPDINANLRFKLARGTRNSDNKTLLVWETEVVSVKNDVPLDEAGFSTWLTRAHDITSNWFFKLIEGELEKEFSNEHNG